MEKTCKFGKMSASIIGQAAVLRVASELLFRGHVPSFPLVDDGVDILLDNGIRLQVKARSLMTRPGYPQGVYFFPSKDRHAKSHKPQRKWTEVCDFLVFMGIDEERFFIVPSSEMVAAFYIPPFGVEMRRKAPLELVGSLREKGLTITQISREVGIDPATVCRHLKRYLAKEKPRGNRYLATFENRWELLRVDQALESIETASAEMREV